MLYRSAQSYEAFLEITFGSAPVEVVRNFQLPLLQVPASTVVKWCTRAFLETGDLLQRFTRAQLRQSFWQIPRTDGYLGLLVVADPAVAAGCIRAMVALFADLFAVDPLDDVCFMWWDPLPWLSSGGRPPLTECKVLWPSILETLSDILRLPSRECQHSALHGLGEFWSEEREPSIAATIDAFMRSHALDPELVEYAGLAKIGLVQ